MGGTLLPELHVLLELCPFGTNDAEVAIKVLPAYAREVGGGHGGQCRVRFGRRLAFMRVVKDGRYGFKYLVATRSATVRLCSPLNPCLELLHSAGIDPRGSVEDDALNKSRRGFAVM